METVTLKLQSETANEMRALIKKIHYGTKTEFIREAIRDKITALRKEAAWELFFSFRGKAKKHITDEELEQIREKTFSKMCKERGIKLD
jgi:Arc/MetJ-type ribon-helix-helix transcriptional regulator